MKRALVVGGEGQVGWEMQRVLHPFMQLVVPSPGELDLAQPRAAGQAVRALAPDVILNCAAYTAVDRAEQEAALAQAINADAVHEMGRAAAALGVPIVHFSTDYVFPGDGRAPYREDDPVGPLSAYGRTKLAGELALAASGAAYWTFRTSWVYAARGRNFVKAIVARAQEAGSLRVVSDQRGSPTWARTLAEVIGGLLVVPLRGGRPLAEAVGATAGVYHLTSRGETSWYEFACFVVDQLAPRLNRPVTVTPIATHEFQTVAVRPAYSVLDTTRLRDTFGVALPHWQDAAHLCLADLPV